jgi:hypothetical protein
MSGLSVLRSIAGLKVPTLVRFNRLGPLSPLIDYRPLT